MQNMSFICNVEKLSGPKRSIKITDHFTCSSTNVIYCITCTWGAGLAQVVRALASRQCDPGSIPGPGVICGLSLLLVLYSAPRGFSPGSPVFPSPQKPTFPNSNSIWNARTFLNEFLWTPRCSVGKQVTFTSYILHSLQNVIHRRNRETTRRQISRTPSRRRERRQKRI